MDELIRRGERVIRYSFKIGETVNLGDDLRVWLDAEGHWVVESSDGCYRGRGEVLDSAILDFLQDRLGLRVSPLV